MSLKNPDERVINSIKYAVKWFEESKILGIKVKTISAPHTEYKYRDSNDDRIAVKDPDAEPIWARY